MVPKPFNQAVFWGGLLKGLWAYASYHPTWPLASKAFCAKTISLFLRANMGGNRTQLQPASRRSLDLQLRGLLEECWCAIRGRKCGPKWVRQNHLRREQSICKMLTLKLRATLSPENRTKILNMEIILFQPMVVFFGWFLGNFLVGKTLESRRM